MDWITKMKLSMELIHEACEENSKLSDATCEVCPFETYCDIVWSELMVTPNKSDWVKKGGEDIR